MESLKGNLFTATMAHIAAEVESVKWIDQNYGQLDGYDTRPSVKFPCTLIDLTGFVYEPLTNGAVQISGKLILSLYTAPFIPSNNVTADVRVAKAVEYYDIENELHQALHNYSILPELKLMHVTEDKIEREDAIRERVLVFEFTYTDVSAVKPKQTVIVATTNPVIGGDILTPH